MSYQLTPSQKLIGFHQYNKKWTYIGLTGLVSRGISKTVHSQPGHTDKIEWQGRVRQRADGVARTTATTSTTPTSTGSTPGQGGHLRPVDAAVGRRLAGRLAGATASTPLIADQYRHQAHARDVVLQVQPVSWQPRCSRPVSTTHPAPSTGTSLPRRERRLLPPAQSGPAVPARHAEHCPCTRSTRRSTPAASCRTTGCWAA